MPFTEISPSKNLARKIRPLGAIRALVGVTSFRFWRQGLGQPFFTLSTPLKSLLLVSALLLGTSLSGCASAKKKTPKEKLPAALPPVEAAEQKIKTAKPWMQSLGKVVLVNQAMAFVLVDIGSAPTPEAGAPLQSYTDSAVSAGLVVSTYQKRPFLIADVVSGMPRVGDSIALGGRRQEPESSAEPLPRETAPLRRFSPEALPRAEAPTEFLPRPTPSPEETRAPALPRVTPEPEPVPAVTPPGSATLEKPVSAGSGIIPGLPATRKKLSE